MVRKWIALFMTITMLLITGCAAKVENEDITDGHIDACVKFAEGNKLVTLPYDDFMWYCSETKEDWEIVSNAVNAEGAPYEMV